MWAGLQVRIDARFTPLFDTETNCKNLYELFIDRATILFLKIIINIFHHTLPLTKNALFRSYSIFAYLLRVHICNINMSAYITSARGHEFSGCDRAEA